MRAQAASSLYRIFLKVCLFRLLKTALRRRSSACAHRLCKGVLQRDERSVDDIRFVRELSQRFRLVKCQRIVNNFVRISEVEHPTERLRCLYVMVELLPKPNKALLDRLMYHLARVAHQEEVNKMGSSNLATIFAPCLLRRAQIVHAQEQLDDVNRQAM